MVAHGCVIHHGSCRMMSSPRSSCQSTRRATHPSNTDASSPRRTANVAGARTMLFRDGQCTTSTSVPGSRVLMLPSLKSVRRARHQALVAATRSSVGASSPFTRRRSRVRSTARNSTVSAANPLGTSRTGLRWFHNLCAGA